MQGTILTHIAAVALAAILSAANAIGQTHRDIVNAATALPRSSPEAEGIPSGALRATIDSMLSQPDAEIHSIIVMRHGNVVAETYPTPFASQYGHALFSVSKTVTGMAVGMAIAEGRLSTADRVTALLSQETLLAWPDSVPSLTAAMTVRDLLTLSSGIAPDHAMRNHRDDWVAGYLSRRPAWKPGTRHAYDSMCTYLLSAIVSRVTGQTLMEYLTPRLFAPLGIDEAQWEMSPEGYSCGGWGLCLRPESMAKIGQLLLQRGEWNGQQLMPAEWVDEMMRPHISSPKYGYGYQMVSCAEAGNPITANIMRADGLHGQFIVVMPSQDMVFVITQCIAAAEPGIREQRMLFNLAKRLSDSPLPQPKGAKESEALNMESHLATPQGRSKSRSLQNGETLRLTLPTNRLGWREMSLTQKADTLFLTATDTAHNSMTICCAYKTWAETTVPTAMVPHPRGATRGAYAGIQKEMQAAASCAWSDSKTIEAKIYFVEWLSAIALRIDTRSGEVTLKLNYDKEPQQLRCDMAQQRKQ